jgi:poly(3-hydroxybutyrate) depolymerase
MRVGHNEKKNRNPQKMRKKILIIIASFILTLSSAAPLTAQAVFNGRITDTVKCLNQSDQSYSLFVPASYADKSKWPVILIFDPGGQGVVAVKAFRKAAEKYGYIIACSLNSKNGPLNINLAAAEFMLNDLLKRFNIDNKRIYAAGFSGGSRFALALASSNNFIAGVIGCGAGLPNDKNLIPAEKSSFIYYGIAGTRDMNWLEMFDLMTFFNSRTSVIPYLRTFDGGHQWPPSEILTEAVEWINLQAMRNRIMVVDSSYFSFCSEKIKTLANNLTAAGDRYDEVRYLKYAIRDFSGTRIAREMKGILTSVEQSKEYRDANREWSDIASRERKMNEKYISMIQSILYSGSLPDTAALWWKREIGSLKYMKERADPGNSQMASRLLNFLSILCSEQGTAYYRQKQYAISGFFFELCTMSDSENPNNYYNLARSLSLSNNKREAVEALNKAVEHGFTSKKAIEIEPAFNSIRNEVKYKLLIAGMK